jgi:phosphatidylglycerol:prolipoprotein diacylglycerol transferase
MAGVFPYFHIPVLDLGPVDLQPFSVLVASGVLLGTWMARKYSERNGLDEDTMRSLGIQLLVWGFISCHVLNTAFYEWDRAMGPWVSKEQPGWVLWFMMWDGISSWGGIIGGGLALYVYTSIRRLDRLAWADWAAYGAIGGWVPGRLACALVHDHLGYPTSFPLAVEFPPHQYTFDQASSAVIRAHDLGLYELMYLVPLFLVIVVLERVKRRKPGLLMGVLAVGYSVPRFFLEFLRRPESDPRYYGLTFAQFSCIAAVIGGIMLLRRKPGVPVPSASAAVASTQRVARGDPGAKKAQKPRSEADKAKRTK